MKSNVIMLQLPPNRWRMQQKYELGTRLTYFWHKNEKKISLNFIFVFEPLRFQLTCPSFLLSKFASQIKLIQSVLIRSVASHRSQGPITRVPGIRVLCPRVASPKAQGSSSKVLGYQVSGYRFPGFQVSGLRVPAFKSWF